MYYASDTIATVSDKVDVYRNNNVTSDSAFENNLKTLASALSDGGVRFFSMYVNYNSSKFVPWEWYSGYIVKEESSWYTVSMTGTKDNSTYIGHCNGSSASWIWQKLATNNIYSFSLPANGSCSFNVASSEHVILISVTGWANAVNGNLWFCTGYATGAQYKNIHKISDSYQQVSLTATSTGYTLSNSTTSGCVVWVLSLNNQPVTQ